MAKHDQEGAEAIAALRSVVALLWILAAVWYVVCEAIAASGFPGYSYVHNYISDLGVLGPDLLGRPLQSNLHAVMTGGFLGQATMFGMGALLAYATFPQRRGGLPFLMLGLLHAAGAALVAMVPSLKTAVPISAAYHGAGAMAAFIGGNLAMVALAIWTKGVVPRAFRIAVGMLGVIGLFSLGVVIVNAAAAASWSYGGLWERGTAYTVMLGELLAGLGILRQAKSGRAAIF